MRKPKNNAEWAADVERRLRRLENALRPWQLTVGRHGDLIAYHLETGQRSVISARSRDTQTRPTEG